MTTDDEPDALNLIALMRDQLAAQADLDDWNFDLAGDVFSTLTAHEIEKAGGLDAIDANATAADAAAMVVRNLDQHELERLIELAAEDTEQATAWLFELVEAKAKARHQERLRRRN